MSTGLQDEQEWLPHDAIERSVFLEAVVHEWITAIKGEGTDQDARFVDASHQEIQVAKMNKAISSASLIRNKVAGQSRIQRHCFVLVPSIIDLLWTTTAFVHEGNKDVQRLTRTLVQLLSNLITQNEELQDELWNQILLIGSKERRSDSRTAADLLARLLQSHDSGTSTAAQVLLLNCTLFSTQRSQLLSISSAGAKIICSMLEVVHTHLEDDETQDEGQERQQKMLDRDCAVGMSLDQSEEERNIRQKRYESLGVLYAFFTNLFDRQLFGPIFTHIGSSDDLVSESITSHVNQSQLSLLKLLDSYLLQGAPTYLKDKEGVNEYSKGLKELVSALERLSVWAEGIMNDVLHGEATAQVDPRLVEVHVALILLLQCLITLGLKTEDEKDSADEIAKAALELLPTMRSDSFVQRLVSLLHTLAEFSPPISPFQPNASNSSSIPVKPPSGHSVTSTGSFPSKDAANRGPVLGNLKRDIVNLLGVLSFQRTLDDKAQVKRVQDTVRKSGGLIDVLNMTQLDEHNPYIRERSIFTLRNLLLGNQESQDLVARIQPASSST